MLPSRDELKELRAKYRGDYDGTGKAPLFIGPQGRRDMFRLIDALEEASDFYDAGRLRERRDCADVVATLPVPIPVEFRGTFRFEEACAFDQGIEAARKLIRAAIRARG